MHASLRLFPYNGHWQLASVRSVRNGDLSRAKAQTWKLAQSQLSHLDDSESILDAFSVASSPHSAESMVPLSMTASKEADVQSDRSLQHAHVSMQENTSAFHLRPLVTRDNLAMANDHEDAESRGKTACSSLAAAHVTQVWHYTIGAASSITTLQNGH